MGNDVDGKYVSGCCEAKVILERLTGESQMFETCTVCHLTCKGKFLASPSTDAIATSPHSTPPAFEAPERMHGKDGGSENAPQVEFRDLPPAVVGASADSDFEAYCPNGHFRAGKNTILQPNCPTCGVRLRISKDSDLDALAQEFKDVGDKIAEHAPGCGCADCLRFCELSDVIISNAPAFDRYRALRNSPGGGKCTCGNPAEALLYTQPPMERCFNCAILTAMRVDCAICKKHPVEAIVRAMADSGLGTIGVCASCLIKTHSAMRN